MRRVRELDQSALSDIYFNATDKLLRSYYGQEQIDYYLSFPRNSEKFGPFIFGPETWVVELHGALIGFGGLEESGYIASLYIDPNYSRSGVGTRLLKHLLERASERNIAKVHTVANPLSKAFFMKHGFQCLGEETRIRNGIPFVRYKMELVS